MEQAPKVENCVVRTYGIGWTNQTVKLEEKLSQGWIVKSSNPLERNGKTEAIEYILERETK